MALEALPERDGVQAVSAATVAVFRRHGVR